MFSYIKTMQNVMFNKIEHFVKEKITNQPSVVITQTCKGYRVNNFKVQKKEDHWVIINPAGVQINMLHSKRLSILSAIFASRKKHSLLPNLNFLDTQLASLKHDRKLFERKLTNLTTQQILEARLSRVIDELEKVYSQISELEKSVGLQ